MARSIPYPPAPRSVPEDLTQPTSNHQTQAFLTVVALVLFFVFYALLAGICVLLLLFSYVRFPWGLLFAVPAILGLLFLLKGFFKKEPPEKNFRVEIYPDEHPVLFEFIDQLCEETSAPTPDHVFLNLDVNAGVYYSNSVLSFLLPPRRNLVLGVGLINFLNLSEFKAVLAHEFGHLSQKGMLLHRWIYRTNAILIDLVANRDWLDTLILSLRDQRGNPLFNLIGWLMFFPVWGFRKLVEWYLTGITSLSRGLSREMEFHADLVAVSVTGSDAIIHALSKIDFAVASLNQALADLRMASDYGLLSADLFFHQNHAAAYLRKRRKNPNLGEPPALPKDSTLSPDIFDPDEEHTADLWATHPPGYDREQNAKETYIRVELDERSPWLLFDSGDDLRERLTRKFYKTVVGLKKDEQLHDPRQVQAFIDEEHAEVNYDPQYHGAYDSRPVRPGALADLEYTATKEPWKPRVLKNLVERLYGEELKKRMEELEALRLEYSRLVSIEVGQEKPVDGEFRFRGEYYDCADAKRLLRQVGKQLDGELDWLAQFDERVFRAHYQMADELGPAMTQDLLYRYQLQLMIQTIDLELKKQEGPLVAVMPLLQSGKQLHPEDFAVLRSAYRQAHDCLVWCIAQADKWPLPKLKNVPKGTLLGEYLLEGKVVKHLRPTARKLTGKWIQKFWGQISDVQERIRRIHFKNLGGLLSLQEEIRKKWMSEFANVDDAQPAPNRSRPGQRRLDPT